MGKKVSPYAVKEGNVFATNKGRFVAMMDSRMNRRGGTVIEGVYEKDLATMLKNPKDTTKMRFVTWTYRRNDTLVELVGTVPSSTTKKLREMNWLLAQTLEKKRSEKMDKLDLKWNPNATVKNASGRRWLGAYDVVTLKGEHVKAGDLVMVKFSNGEFKMVMGNDNGVTYDPKTGNFLCRSPWKVGRPAQHKLRLDKYGQLGYKKVVTKARSMPPDSLLYLIQKKEDYDKTHGAY
jgi:hypothetical protein